MSEVKTIASTNPTISAEQLFNTITYHLPKDAKDRFPRKTTPYTITYENWYQTIPYAFRIVGFKDQDQKQTDGTGMNFYFPVNPDNLTINTPFAATVTPTLGGIVQEHSGPVFYNISISGNTGALPAINYMNGKNRDASKELRPKVNEGGISSSALGGFGQNTINAVNSVVAAVTGTSSKMVDASRERNSGYTAYHVLYKFLWLYHLTKSQGGNIQLRFMNYKDNQQYDCTVSNFNLTRDKGRPHLYQYSIQLKAWKLSNPDKVPDFSNDDRLKQLGLNEGPSVKALLFRTITDTKTVLNGASGLMNAAAGDLAF